MDLSKDPLARAAKEKEIAGRTTEMEVDLNVALDYMAGDGVLRLSKQAAISRAQKAREPNQALIEMFESLPFGTEVKLTPVRKDNVISVHMQVTMPE